MPMLTASNCQPRGATARRTAASMDRGVRALVVDGILVPMELARLPYTGRANSRLTHEFRWLPYAEARPLLVDRLRTVLDWADGRLPRPY